MGFQESEVTPTSHRLSLSPDDAALARLGKKPVLKRNFGFFTILGFSCTVLITWEGALILFLSGLENGGPSGIVYGFIVVWIGYPSVFATSSEMASMAPMLLGYITGWLTLTGWQASVAVVLFSYAVNTAFPSSLSKFEGLVLVLHILGFFAVIFPLEFLREHATSDATQGLSFCIGILGNVFAFIGGHGAIYASFHPPMSPRFFQQKSKTPAVMVPWSIMTGLLINSVLGFSMMITTLYSIGDIKAQLAENPIYPFMAILNNAVGNAAGATVMSALVIILAFGATTDQVSSTSRVYWAFALSRRTNIPVYSVVATTSIAFILSLVNIGSTTAFNGVISISVAGLFGSYLVAASLLLYRRLTGGIRLQCRWLLLDYMVKVRGKFVTHAPLRGSPVKRGGQSPRRGMAQLLFVVFNPPIRDIQQQRI
ncbi:amino acid transporter-like protein [Poronia punctata]|nr:amino acid transporter-like protein [Poronia punctata]